MLTDLSFLNIGAPWPPVSERERLHRYADNQLLWAGEHPKIFNDWVRLLRQDNRAALEFVFNWPKRLSTLWADLLLGEPPRFDAGVDGGPEQAAIDSITTANALAMTAYEVAIDCSRYGDGLFKLRVENNQAVIEGQPPSLWFPVVSRDNLRIVIAHVLAWTFDIVEATVFGQTTVTYLRCEIHMPGRIENRLYRLKDGKIGSAVDLHTFFPDRAEMETTPLPDAFMIVPVSGLRTTDAYYGMDDYSDLISIVQEFEVRFAQISRILDKHADPSMYGPPEALNINPTTGESEFKGGGNYFPTESGDEAPGYITWDGQLAAAFEELDNLLKQFYIVSETSPAAFGQMDAGLATSGSALRRLMMAPLAKVNRMRLRFDPALKQVLILAARLQNETVPESIDIKWRDGLPEDPLEAAQIEQIRSAAGNTSVFSSIRRLDGGTDSEIQEELDRINEDSATSAATNPLMPQPRLRQPPASP